MSKLKIIQSNRVIEISEELNPLFSRAYSEGIHTIILEASGSLNELSKIQEEIVPEEIQKILFDDEDVLLKTDESILNVECHISSIGVLTQHLTVKDNRKKLNISIVFSNITGE
jgi:hypothetical protein